MPFIEARISKTLTDREREELQEALGKAVGAELHKPLGYVMTGIIDGYHLYMGGKALAAGAMITVSQFGTATRAQYQAIAAAVCSVLGEQLAISPAQVYINFGEFEHWGFNGALF